MSDKLYSLQEIKEAAFDALAGVGPTQIANTYSGMNLLINQLSMETLMDIPDGAQMQQPEKAPPKEAKPGEFKGFGVKTKKAAFEMLRAYRDNGGSMNAIADASNGFLTIDELYRMLNAEKVTLDKWETLAAVMTNMEGGND